jgi:hypothetical protein
MTSPRSKVLGFLPAFIVRGGNTMAEEIYNREAQIQETRTEKGHMQSVLASPTGINSISST